MFTVIAGKSASGLPRHALAVPYLIGALPSKARACSSLNPSTSMFAFNLIRVEVNGPLLVRRKRSLLPGLPDDGERVV
jgi:hypothetical protein